MFTNENSQGLVQSVRQYYEAINIASAMFEVPALKDNQELNTVKDTLAETMARRPVSEIVATLPLEAVREPGFSDFTKAIKDVVPLVRELNALMTLWQQEYQAQLEDIRIREAAKKTSSLSDASETEASIDYNTPDFVYIKDMSDRRRKSNIQEKLSTFQKNRIAWEENVKGLLLDVQLSSKGSWKNTAKYMLMAICADLTLLAAGAACVATSLIVTVLNPFAAAATLPMVAVGLSAMAASIAIPLTVAAGAIMQKMNKPAAELPSVSPKTTS